jgi:ParB family chromosome partitioning protein
MQNARQATFERILANAAITFSAPQLRVFLRALVNLDPYDFAEDVAAFYVGEDENNQQTPEEVLSFTIDRLPDEKLTGFALRLVLTGHTDIPRESGFDYLAQAETAFVPEQPKKAQAKKKPTVIKQAKAVPKKATSPKKKIAA